MSMENCSDPIGNRTHDLRASFIYVALNVVLFVFLILFNIFYLKLRVHSCSNRKR
jgi:hypothetical protein